MVALSPDTVIIIDTVDNKNIHILDSTSGRVLSKLPHAVDVVKVALNQHRISQERLLVFADRNKDFFVANVGTGASQSLQIPTFKIISQIESFTFNDETDVLVGLADGKLYTWYHPATPFIDKDLLSLTTTSTDGTEFGRSAEIINYTGNRVSIRKSDGTNFFYATPSDIEILYQLTRDGRWDEALRLCRHQKSQPLWACLATMALPKKQLDTVEQSLAEVNEVAKVEYIQYIKSIPSEEGRLAELALYRRQQDEAERILLQASPPLVYRAVKMNIKLHRWDRALEIGAKFQSHVDTVLGFRQRFLQQFNKIESKQRFIQYASKVSVDWNVIDSKIAKEKDEERARAGSHSKRK